MLSLQKLRTIVTRSQSLDVAVQMLTSLGFDTSSWQDGSIQKTMLVTLATLASDFTEISRALANFGYNDYATGDALNEFSWSRFGKRKLPAERAAGPMTLRSTASIPYVIKVGQLIAATAGNVQFRNTSEGTLSAGGSLQLDFEAILAGNAGNNAVVDRLLTPLAGVSVKNDVGIPWHSIRTGRDEQSDASMRLQNATQWARLSVEWIADAYINLALEHGASKVTVHDQNPRGPGTLDVYVSADNAVLNDTEMALLQKAYHEHTFYTDLAWTSPWTPGNVSRVAVIKPATQALDLDVNIYHDTAANSSDVYADADTALTNLLARTPIGGFKYAPGPQNILPFDDLVEAIRGIDGVRKVVFNSPVGDVSINPLKLLVRGTWGLHPFPLSS